jgi:hypothetical protein
MRERGMTTIPDMIRRLRIQDMMSTCITIANVEEIYSQLMEHLSDRFTDHIDAINKATNFLAKYYLGMEG